MGRTKIDNKTDLPIDFVVDGGICPLRSLRAGKSGSVSLSRIRKHCIDKGSPDWPIRVFINHRYSGIKLHPRYHILEMTRIILRYKWRADGSRIPIAEGVEENFRDRIFDTCINWDNKIYVEIAEADSTWTSVREREIATVAAPWIGIMNNPQSRMRNQRNVDGGIAIPSSVIRPGHNRTMSVLGSERNSMGPVTGRDSTVPDISSGRDSIVPVIESERDLTVHVTGSRRDSTVPKSGRNSTVSVIGSEGNLKVPVTKSKRNSTGPVLGSRRNSTVPVIRSGRNATVPVESRPNRFPGLLSRRRRVMTHFLIFCVAFTLVVVVKKLTK